MEKFEKLNPDHASQEPTALPPAFHEHRQEAVASRAESTGDAATTHADKHAAPDEEKLARSLRELQKLPHNFSRSYLVPYTEHLLLLERKKHGRRKTLDWLLQEHGVRSNLATLSYFLGRAKKEEKRLKKARRARSTPSADKPASISDVPQTPQTHKSSSDQPRQLEAREAIRAVKKNAESAKSQGDKPTFKYDGHKALINNPKSDPN